MTIRIGIVGCGAVANRWYLKGLSGKNKSYETVIVCDIIKDRALKAAKNYQIPNYTTDIKELLKYQLDLVVILTRHFDHYDHVKFFLEKGINVYCEKPFAHTYTKAKKLVALANQKKVLLCCAPQIMLSSRNMKIKSALESGLIGKITFLRGSCSNLGPAFRAHTDYDPEWFYHQGGSMVSLGIYGLSTIVFLLGMPKYVSSFEGIAIRKRTVMYGPAKGKKFTVLAPDNVVALLDYTNASFVCFDGSYSIANPPEYEFEIHGTKGSIFVKGFGGKKSIKFIDLYNKIEFIGPQDKCHKKWTLAWGVEESIKALIEKRTSKTNAKFALNVLRLIDAIKSSSKKRCQIRIL